jgi:hypothetical protein
MNLADIQAFLARDWAAVERLKAVFWIQQKRALGPAAALEVSDGLRRFTQSLRPDRPSAAERREDIDTHARVGRALRLAGADR